MMDRNHQRERDGTSSERATNDRTDTGPESEEPLSRRDALKAGAVAVGSAAALSSTASTVAAATRHGINFDRVLHAVDDLGMDDTGSTPIDNDIDWRDGTLIEFPSGTFALDDDRRDNLTRYGWVAEDGASPTIVPAADKDNWNSKYLVFWGKGEDLLFEGFDIDYTQSGYGGLLGLRLSAGEGYWLDVTVDGPQANHEDLDYLFSPYCRDSSASIEVRNFSGMDGCETYGTDPSTWEEDPHGIWVGYPHAGDILFDNCEIGYWPDNGLYADGAGLDTDEGDSVDGGGGTVRVENCYFENNNISNIRLGTAGSYAKNCEVVVDDDCPTHTRGSNARGAWLRYENGIVLDDVDMKITGHRGSGGIVETERTADNEIKNCTVEILSNANYKIPVYRKPGSGSTGSTYNNVSVVSGLDNADLSDGQAAVEINDTSGMTVQNCCIQTTSSNRDGIEFVDSSSATLSDSNINATGTAVVETNSTVSKSNLTYDESCPVYSDTTVSLTEGFRLTLGGEIEALAGEEPGEIQYVARRENSNGYLTKVNSGSVVWDIDVGAEPLDCHYSEYYTACVVSFNDGSVRLYNPDGTEKWRNTAFDNAVYAVTTEAGKDYIFAADGNGTVKKFDSSQNVVWSAEVTSATCEGMDVQGDDLVTAADDYNVYKLDDDNGSVKWSYDWGGTLEDAMMDTDENVYACGDDGKVRKFSDSGTREWTNTTHSTEIESLIVARDHDDAHDNNDWADPGTTWTGANDGTLVKIDTNGYTLYEHQVFNSARVDSIVLGDGGDIYVGSASGELVGLDET